MEWGGGGWGPSPPSSAIWPGTGHVAGHARAGKRRRAGLKRVWGAGDRSGVTLLEPAQAAAFGCPDTAKVAARGSRSVPPARTILQRDQVVTET